MKSTGREIKETSTGPEETTSPETDKEFVSARGVPFELYQFDNGLWGIKMLRGGQVPRICDEKFTSRSLAERELIKYIKSKDKLGFAKYPKDE